MPMVSIHGPIAALCARLTPGGRRALGVDAAELRPGGHEVARAFLTLLAKNYGLPSEDDTMRAALIMGDQVEVLRLAVQDLGRPIDWLRIPPALLSGPSNEHHWLIVETVETVEKL